MNGFGHVAIARDLQQCLWTQRQLALSVIFTAAAIAPWNMSNAKCECQPASDPLSTVCCSELGGRDSQQSPFADLGSLEVCSDDVTDILELGIAGWSKVRFITEATRGVTFGF